jgi:hypothetical protein
MLKSFWLRELRPAFPNGCATLWLTRSRRPAQFLQWSTCSRLLLSSVSLVARSAWFDLSDQIEPTQDDQL